ncbi:hypothetical protein U9M48_002787 [Paspalum notatum var. saurae]|uniref:GAG-pre-integrase domain-containing protein n=1 Tax=Paspalum notatum var. saurae TaxID=547442 RepID=A0AAQ3PKG1_PASNO
MTTLRKMAREGLVRGLPDVEPVNWLCEVCLAGKQKRSPFSRSAQYNHTQRVLELVHSDLCDPMSPSHL